MRSVISLIPVAALLTAPATADVLEYRYVGKPLELVEGATQAYADVIQQEIDSGNPDAEFALQDALDALDTPVLSPIEYSFTIDQATLPTGSVRGQTINFLVGVGEIQSPSPVGVLGTAAAEAEITFSDGGQVVAYDIFAIDDFGGLVLNSVSGDFAGNDPSFLFSGGPAIVYGAEPGRFELVSGDVAPIPTPASLPLLMGGVGALALWSRRRVHS